MISVYDLTITKLKEAIVKLNNSFSIGHFEEAINAVKEFKHYSDCFYCQRYRVILIGHAQGCCQDCKLHKYGEKMIGRKLSYNGCYKIPCYREVVKLSWEFCAGPNEQLANLLIKNMEECINQMTIHKDEVKD